jgi:nicotinamide mononucleotide (NMN) deamidase PncC
VGVTVAQVTAEIANLVSFQLNEDAAAISTDYLGGTGTLDNTPVGELMLDGEI